MVFFADDVVFFLGVEAADFAVAADAVFFFAGDFGGVCVCRSASTVVATVAEETAVFAGVRVKVEVEALRDAVTLIPF